MRKGRFLFICISMLVAMLTLGSCFVTTPPSELDIPASEISGDDVMKEVKKYLRNTYNHYLSGFAGDPTVNASEDGETYHVTNINWGRKI